MTSTSSVLNTDTRTSTSESSAAGTPSKWNGRNVTVLTTEEKVKIFQTYIAGNRRKIGSGAYSDVYLVKYDGKSYAVKQMRSKSITLKREFTIGPILQHPNIVKSHGSVSEISNIIILDFVGEHDLDQKIVDAHFSVRVTGQRFSRNELLRRWNNCRSLLLKVRSALAYMHEKKCLYRDLRGENIRVSFKKYVLDEVYLVDLGFVRRVDTTDGLLPTENNQTDTQRRFSSCGAPVTMSPQVHKNTYYTQKADCWSLGALLHYILVGSYPFEAESDSTAQIKDNVINSPLVLPHWMPDVAKDLLEKLLSKDEKDRPTLDEIENHPFFTCEDPGMRGQKLCNLL